MTTDNTYNVINNTIDPIYCCTVHGHKKGHVVNFDKEATSNGLHLEAAKALEAKGFSVKVSERVGRAKYNSGSVYGRILILS